MGAGLMGNRFRPECGERHGQEERRLRSGDRAGLDEIRGRASHRQERWRKTRCRWSALRRNQAASRIGGGRGFRSR
jgi:hypothetical protein